MEQPISLYLDLEPGQIPDLEVVSRASISFSRALRETAYIIDPSIDVRVGFQSSTEGSLSINAVLQAIGKLRDRKRLLAIAAGVALFFSHELVDYGLHKALDRLFGHELSKGEIEQIAVAVAKAMKNPVAEQHVREVYRALESDKAVRGVTVTENPGPPLPGQIVPRAEFMDRSSATIVNAQTEQRAVTTFEQVILISPVLIDKTRSWKFWMPSIGQFGARVEDEKFIKSLVSGRRKIPMRGGIRMDVEMVSHEVREAGVWTVERRVITRVMRVRSQSVNLDLFMRLSKEGDGDEE